ncbi:MAG: class I SAM-dependent methyltransferase [Pseudomonadota bacterium]
MGYKAWQLGEPGGILYSFFDFLRRRLNQKLVNYLSAKALQERSCSILEAGSGPAFATSILSCDQRIELAVAIDIDVEALRQALQRDNCLNAVVADLENLPFRSNCISLTWNSSTLEHLPDPERSLSEMTRVTRPGGNVFVGVPNLYGPLGFQTFIPDTSTGIWIGTAFSSDKLKCLMSGVGLEPVEAIFYFFRFFVGVLARKSSPVQSVLD